MRILDWIDRWFGLGAHRGGEKSPPRPRRDSTPASTRPAQTFWFGGKPFVVITEGTAERDHYVTRLAGRAGLREVEIGKGELPEDFAQRLLYELVDSGVIFDVLGGLLIPRHIDPWAWTPQLASDTADYFRHLHSPEDKAALNVHILSFLEDFFARGMGSLVSSPTASGATQANNAPSTERIVTESGAT